MTDKYKNNSVASIKISVTILTKNSSLHIQKVLDSLQRFDEVVVYDTGSHDDTLIIAEQYPNVKISRGEFIGFGPTHNRATEQARHDWILSIDSDEVMTQDLVEEIAALQLRGSAVYSIARNNFYRGKWITGCGWYPDRVVRLYNRRSTSFSDDLVHEKVILNQCTLRKLRAPLLHYPYHTIDDFLRKMQSYSTLFAQQNQGRKKGSFLQAIGHGLAACFKSYILKRGIMLGSEGLEISLYNGITAYYKYLKLRDLDVIKDRSRL